MAARPGLGSMVRGARDRNAQAQHVCGRILGFPRAQETWEGILRPTSVPLGKMGASGLLGPW